MSWVLLWINVGFIRDYHLQVSLQVLIGQYLSVSTYDGIKNKKNWLARKALLSQLIIHVQDMMKWTCKEVGIRKSICPDDFELSPMLKDKHIWSCIFHNAKMSKRKSR